MLSIIIEMIASYYLDCCDSRFGMVVKAACADLGVVAGRTGWSLLCTRDGHWVRVDTP
jgi:hypothetical protein